MKNFPNIDIVVHGQGEETLREFLTSGSTRNINGICYRNNGKIIRTKEREPNIIPFLYPDRKLRKYKYYLFGNRIDCVYTSHGCPHRCVYCEFEGSKWNSRSAEDIFQEIKSMDKDVKFVLINDNNFLENAQRAEKFIDLLNEHKIRKTFWAQARALPLAKRKDLVTKLNTAGFILAIGVESPQDHVLKWLRKGYMRNINDEAFENMKRTSIVIQAYYIIGNYKETKEEILSITDYSHDKWVDFVCLNRLRCYPQSQLAGIIDKLDGIYVDKTDLRVYTDEVKKKELTKLTKIINNKFYLSRTAWRTLCKLSYLMNVPLVFRYFICSLINLYVFKRNRKMISFTDAAFRLNLLLPFDLFINYLLKFSGRLIYGIKRK